VFDRENPKDRLYAVGGYGAGNDPTGMDERLADEGAEMGQ
jgi:hypothetical protein